MRTAYANRHGYDLKVDFDGFKDAGAWHKLTMIESAIKLERFDWIWWIDFDTLITNTTINVADIIEEALEKHPNPNSVSMIFTPDWCGPPKRFLPISDALPFPAGPSNAC
jgi:mannan polymerase II complex MNN10 subunit